MLNVFQRTAGMAAAAFLLLGPTLIAALAMYGFLMLVIPTKSCAGTYLGRVGSNPYCSDCTANPYAPINNPFNPRSPRNAFGRYGNPFSPYSANNPFATRTPRIYGD